jgi:hypothetical protein
MYPNTKGMPKKFVPFAFLFLFPMVYYMCDVQTMHQPVEIWDALGKCSILLDVISSKKVNLGEALCNPSYSGGRDQEDHSSKPAQASSSARPYLEKPFKK